MSKLTLGDLAVVAAGVAIFPYCAVRHPKQTYRLLKYGRSW